MLNSFKEHSLWTYNCLFKFYSTDSSLKLDSTLVSL